MRIENTKVYGFFPAIQAMRNPMDSWNKSDSGLFPHNGMDYPEVASEMLDDGNEELFMLGDADAELSQRLTKAGAEHSKHLRQICVWADLALPRYVWAEFDTYNFVPKISCSTMHTLMKQAICPEMFESESEFIKLVCKELNKIRSDYLNSSFASEKKGLLKRAKEILPESFLQKRSICTNYAVLYNMYNQRKNHRLPQWHVICNWIINLPYFRDLTGIEEK